MIVNQELIKMVGSNTLFKGVSKELLKTFIKPKNNYGVKEGTIIYSKGDESTNLYLIVEGEVKIKFCDANKVEHRFITDFFGEDELLNKNVRASHAVANNDCILYSIKSEELESLMSQHSKIASNINKNENFELYGLVSNNQNEEDSSLLNEQTENSDELTDYNNFDLENGDLLNNDNSLKKEEDRKEPGEGIA